MHNFRNLDVWKKSIQLNKIVYLTTGKFPNSEIYGLTSQMRRCSVSISSNIAEGSSRKSNKDFIRFLEISLGSAFELETQFVVAREIEFINETILIEFSELITEIQKKIFRLIESLRDKE